MIPKDPDEYRKWLERKRSDYNLVANKLEPALVISSSNLGRDVDLEALGIEGLNKVPSYEYVDRFCSDARWVYVIDLDLELFVILDRVAFPLSDLPANSLDLLPKRKNRRGQVERRQVYPSIKTCDIQPRRITYNTDHAFLQLNPTLVNPKTTASITIKPGVIICREVFNTFRQWYQGDLVRVRDTSLPNEFLFREFAFAILCLTTCSPDLFRMVHLGNMGYWNQVSGHFDYGTINDNEAQSNEFVKRFLSPFYKEGTTPGSAPHSTTYWLLGALVSLRRDIVSYEAFQDAIISVVDRGRSEGRTDFHAIIFSIKHFILVRVTENGVQHTKRLGLVADKAHKEEQMIFDEDEGEDENEDDMAERNNANRRPEWLLKEASDLQGKDNGRPLKAERDTKQSPGKLAEEGSRERDWFDCENVETFDIIANFWEVVTLQQ